MDPPMQTRIVVLRGLDIADKSMPGCLEGSEDTSPPAVEAEPPDIDAINPVIPGCR